MLFSVLSPTFTGKFPSHLLAWICIGTCHGPTWTLDFVNLPGPSSFFPFNWPPSAYCSWISLLGSDRVPAWAAENKTARSLSSPDELATYRSQPRAPQSQPPSCFKKSLPEGLAGTFLLLFLSRTPSALFLALLLLELREMRDQILASFRFPDGRQHTRGQRLHSSSSSHHRAKLPGQWTDGSGDVAMPSRSQVSPRHYQVLTDPEAAAPSHAKSGCFKRPSPQKRGRQHAKYC